MMDTIVLILVGIALITTTVSIITTMKMIKIRRQVNLIISNHNEITNILEEENRLLQSRLLVIPNEIIVSIEKVIDNNPDLNINEFKEFLNSNNKSYNDKDK